MKNKVPCCVINVVIHNKINAAKTVHMEIVVYSNKKLIYHFHQETNSTVHLVEIVMYDTFLTSFAVYAKRA